MCNVGNSRLRAGVLWKHLQTLHLSHCVWPFLIDIVILVLTEMMLSFKHHYIFQPLEGIKDTFALCGLVLILCTWLLFHTWFIHSKHNYWTCAHRYKHLYTPKQVFVTTSVYSVQIIYGLWTLESAGIKGSRETAQTGHCTYRHSGTMAHKPPLNLQLKKIFSTFWDSELSLPKTAFQ